MALDGAEGPELPLALLALAVKVYDVPMVSPVTVQLPASGLPVGLETVQVFPSGSEVTVKLVAVKPVDAAVTSTEADRNPAVAVTDCGADGTSLTYTRIMSFNPPVGRMYRRGVVVLRSAVPVTTMVWAGEG
jgi:hypothetical protein